MTIVRKKRSATRAANTSNTKERSKKSHTVKKVARQRLVRRDMITFRVTEEERELLTAALQVSPYEKEGAYVRHSMMTQIRMDLADKREFVLDEAEWVKFVTALERPVKVNTALENLLRRPSVFEVAEQGAK